jgi:hypothetical protein
MTYYILQQDPRVPEQPSVLSCPAGIDPEAWISGQPVTVPQGPLHLKMSPRSGKFRGVIIEGILTLFHKVFSDELTRLGVANLQYFPVELENPEGQTETKYSLVNVVGMLDAVDKSKSVIEPRATGGRGWLRSFTIDPSATQGQRIFRIPDAPSLIIIDGTLEASLADFNLAGAWMLPTEEYEGF